MMKKRRLITASALIEFMLVIPVFVTMVAGLIETSILLYDKTIITHGSREGARYGVMLRGGGYAETVDVQTYTSNYCNGQLMSFGTSPSVTVSLTLPDSGEAEFGEVLAVTVNYTYNGLIKQYNLTSTTVMSYE